MLKLIIQDDTGCRTVVPFVLDEITIGRQEGNTICLAERNVSRRHARFSRHDGCVWVEDLGSQNGIQINGERIEGSWPVQSGDRVRIGNYDVALEGDLPFQATWPAPAPAPASAGPQEPAAAPTPAAPPAPAAPPRPAPPLPRAAAQEGAPTPVATIPLARREVLVPHAPLAPRLVVVSTGLAGREFTCARTPMRIGRAPDSDIHLDHPSLSRTHAQLERDEAGGWHVVDLESANGLSVNAERCTRAALRHGDIITLGRLQLRFATRPEAAPRPPPPVPPRRRAAPLLRAVAVAAGLATLGVLLVLALRPTRLLAPPAPGSFATPAALAPEPAPPEPAPAAEPPSPPPAPPLGPQERLAAAREAMEARRLEEAVALLESLRDAANGPPPPATHSLLAHVRAEQEAGHNLDRALRELDEGRLEVARRLARLSAGTRVWAPELQQVRARLRTAPRARNLYRDGLQLFDQKQYKAAETLFRRCLDVDQRYASCHRMLGGMESGRGRNEEAAFHYRRFLELAPQHTQAPEVRQWLQRNEHPRAATP